MIVIEVFVLVTMRVTIVARLVLVAPSVPLMALVPVAIAIAEGDIVDIEGDIAVIAVTVVVVVIVLAAVRVAILARLVPVVPTMPLMIVVPIAVAIAEGDIAGVDRNAERVGEGRDRQRKRSARKCGRDERAAQRFQHDFSFVMADIRRIAAA